jgi:hypothetical protein
MEDNHNKYTEIAALLTSKYTDEMNAAIERKEKAVKEKKEFAYFIAAAEVRKYSQFIVDLKRFNE